MADREPPECIHHLQFCDRCGGLEVLTLRELGGVSGIEIGDGAGKAVSSNFSFGPARVFLGPSSTPCAPPTTALPAQGAGPSPSPRGDET